IIPSRPDFYVRTLFRQFGKSFGRSIYNYRVTITDSNGGKLQRSWRQIRIQAPETRFRRIGHSLQGTDGRSRNRPLRVEQRHHLSRRIEINLPYARRSNFGGSVIGSPVSPRAIASKNISTGRLFLHHLERAA